MKNIIFSLLLILLMCCIPSLLFAQPNPGGDPESIPFDGGLSVLLATGIVYGIKKYKDRKNKEEE